MGTVECGLCGKTTSDPLGPEHRISVCKECADEEERLIQEAEAKELEPRQCPECNQMTFFNDPNFGCWFCTQCGYEREELNP